MKPLGRIGEDLATDFLTKHGYKIIERNYRIRGGEIDIIALEDNTLIIVEVKTRTSHKYGLPQESVSQAKLKFLERAALFYRSNRKNLPLAERIDVVTVDYKNGDPQINLIKNASY